MSSEVPQTCWTSAAAKGKTLPAFRTIYEEAEEARRVFKVPLSLIHLIHVYLYVE